MQFRGRARSRPARGNCAQKHSGKPTKSHSTMPNDRTQHQTTTRQTRRRAFHSRLGRSLGCPFSTISVDRLAADRGIEIGDVGGLNFSNTSFRAFLAFLVACGGSACCLASCLPTKTKEKLPMHVAQLAVVVCVSTQLAVCCVSPPPPPLAPHTSNHECSQTVKGRKTPPACAPPQSGVWAQAAQQPQPQPQPAPSPHLKHPHKPFAMRPPPPRPHPNEAVHIGTMFTSSLVSGTWRSWRTRLLA